MLVLDRLEIGAEAVEQLASVGYDAQERNRSGSLLIRDDQIGRLESFDGKLELLTTKQAAEKYDWVEDKLERSPGSSLGYFLHVKEDVLIDNPIQTGFYMKDERQQVNHNLVVAEPGSSLRLISGCTADIDQGRHVGSTVFEVGEGADVSLTKLHHWPSTHKSVSRSQVTVDKNGSFNSYYIALTPVKNERSLTRAQLKAGATANFKSLVHASQESQFNIEGEIDLQGEGASSQVVSKSISTGGLATTDELITGQARATQGHIECDGLLLSEEGEIKAVPQLDAVHPETNLSHEAAVGKISEKELNYLMARGLSEEQAKSLVIQGFLSLDDHKLPQELEKRAQQAAKRIAKQGTA